MSPNTYHQRFKTLREKFWEKVDLWFGISDEDCWEWTASKNEFGYGRFTIGAKTLASQSSWILNRGEIPEELCVCHTCDNPACVNPSHLFLGAHIENVRDMHAKGRHYSAPGESNANAALTNDIVLKIRRMADDGVRQIEISKELGIADYQVSRIALRKSWKHV